MKLKLFLIGAVVALSGCASTNDYALYAETQRSIANARASADVARYQALAEIAKSGDATARVAAVMSLQMGGQQVQSNQNVAAPRAPGEVALQWASILLPNLTQMYSINRNAEVAIRQSENSSLVARSTNEAFVNIASQIQAPGAVTTTTTTTNVADSYNRTRNNTEATTTNTTNTTTTSNSNNRTPTTTSTTTNTTNTNTNSNNTTRTRDSNNTNTDNSDNSNNSTNNTGPTGNGP